MPGLSPLCDTQDLSWIRYEKSLNEWNEKKKAHDDV